jgi:hypothetical protein
MIRSFLYRLLILVAVAVPTLAVPAAFVGCAITPIEKGQNVALVNAERAQKVAVATIDAFLKFDHENAAWLAENAPAVRQVAVQVRREFPAAIREVRRLTAEYKATVQAGQQPVNRPLQGAVDKLESLARNAANAQVQAGANR